MKLGFDLDGTLDHPELKDLCNLLYDAGAEIHILTVGSLGAAGYESTEQRKRDKLQTLGVKYHHLHLIIADTFEEAGDEKAALCEYHQLKIMIDDSETFVKQMTQGTTAIILHVRMAGEPGGRSAR